MFDACCGGAITSKMSGFNFKIAPYLSRSYPCTFCKDCKLYKWSAEYSLKELRSYFDSDLGEIKDLKITKKDASGFVQEMLVRGSKKSIYISGKKVYSLFKNIKSTRFKVIKEDNIIKFRGIGYGHCLGICQWGARQMIENGHTIKEVLKFYYPKTVIMKVV